MKHLITTVSLILLLFSCKKENSLPIDSIADKNVLFFQKVKSQLKDSLSSNDYKNMDTSRMYKSTDAQSKGCFVRIGLLNKKMAIDFFLLKTDTLGNIKAGKIIHVDQDTIRANKRRFQGGFSIASLTRTATVKKRVRDEILNSVHIETGMMEAEDPIGEQTLPDCVITCYSTGGGDEGDWYWYGGFFNDYGGGGGSYTYGYSGGGAGSTDKTIQVELESDDNDPISIRDYLKCFSTIPDVGASYQISIFSDIPVNGDPTQMFNWDTRSPGHSFIQLRKVNGGQIIQQNMGFYPEYGWKVIANANIGSKVVDNADHEFNASLSLTINGDQFHAALNKIQTIANYDYNITTWNCTDFALSVFNAASTQPLTIPKFVIPTSEYPMPTTFALSNTPQGLYDEIQALQTAHNTTFGGSDIPGVCGYVGGSHGSCQ